LAGGESGPAIAPGNSAASLLYRKLVAGEMPPQNPLSSVQVAAFKTWIDAGAPYDDEPLIPVIKRADVDWWSLQKVKQPALPRVSRPEWLRTPVDAFVLAKLDEKGLSPAPEADRGTLVRRATFDLLGLPPTPEQVLAFVEDPNPNAYEWLIDRLLASPHYGERWARHWLDVVRFAESHGYEMNTLRPNAWPYRDYVIRAYNTDVPYPQFILEQLAGDTVKDADLLSQSATGFLVGGAHDMVGNGTIEGRLQQRMDDLDDMITAVGATFLGLTVNCARCHDHKYDPISQRDYYGLQAILAGVQHGERELTQATNRQRERELAQVQKEVADFERQLDDTEPLAQPNGKPSRPPVNPRRNVERFEPTSARYVRIVIGATSNHIEPCIDELEIYAADEPTGNIALRGVKVTASSTLANSPIHRLEHLNDGRYGNGRSWISAEPGKGWVQVELPRPARINRIVWGRDREERYTDRLATAYHIETALALGKWRTVASSVDRIPSGQKAAAAELSPASGCLEQERSRLRHRIAQLRERLTSLEQRRLVYVGSFMPASASYVLRRGDPMLKAEPVSPSSLSAIPVPLRIAPGGAERDRRVALARWLADPANPLPARVMVNRIWQYHFGQGIVATPSDFGFNGGRPSHPELLDWLAHSYVDNGWRLKPLHRLIMLSSTYRQSGRTHAKAFTLDGQNRLLWRRTPRRLEAEAVRDAILSVSSELDSRMGGPGYSLWEKNTNYVVVFKPKGELGRDEFRRMIYQFKPRSQQDPTFGIFDCPDAALAKPQRTTSTTALQALNLLNSGFLLAQSEAFATRLVREAGPDPTLQARRAFLLAFGREPEPTEQNAAAVLIRTHGVPAFCRALYNANEFVYVD
jgi:hypothetical protein